MEEDLDIVKYYRTIDTTDTSITSNITRVHKKKFICTINQFAQYELCFGNQFHVSEDGKNIKSTGFRISGEVILFI